MIGLRRPRQGRLETSGISALEEYGEGIDRMFDLMDARLMDPPIIVATPSSVTVTLHNRFLVTVEEQAWLALDEVIMRAGSSGMEAQARKRQMLLDEIAKLGSLSTAEGADLLGEDPVLVRHLLNDLVAGGQAAARGQTRARRYSPV